MSTKEDDTIHNVKSETVYTVSMEGNATLSVQVLQLLELAKLCWDGATELIDGEAPERATQ